MKKIIFYGYSKCSTCTKASKWLNQKGLEYKLLDIIQETPSVKYLNLALDQYELDKKRLFNIRGKLFKSMALDICNLSNKEIIQLLSSNGKLIKRPFLVNGLEKIILGFNEKEYSESLA